ncbi:MAG TPA: hypothetical protein VIJ56_04565 [Acidimicrobiales bacterium]
MADAAEWEADSKRDDQEGSRDGDAWTDEVGPGGSDEPGADFDRPPDHVPQLHRAMSEAAEDLDAVEDRLSTLFDRTEGPGPGSATRPASTQRSTLHPEFAAGAGTTGAADDEDDAAADDDILDLFEDDEVGDTDDDVRTEEPIVADRRAIIGEYEDDIGGDFAELDAELAAEEPDGPAEPKRRMFGRRAKGTTAARR